jgi:hypothetical protein
MDEPLRSLRRIVLSYLLAVAGVATARAASLPAEIQVGLCGEPAAIARALDLERRGASYETWLFDDADLALFARDVRIRLRMRKHRAELAVKVGNQDCSALPAGLVPPQEGKCEFDVHGDAIAGAVSLTRELDARTAAALVAGTRPVADVLGPAQVRFLRDIVRAHPLPAGVRPLGPIANSVYATRDGVYDVDVAQMPGGERFAEISVKVPVGDATKAQAALAARLTRAGVTACADQSGQAVNKLRLLLAK